MRQNLTKGLDFSKEDRDENIRRIGFVAHLLTKNDVIVLVCAISPYRKMREQIRQNIGDFMNYNETPLMNFLHLVSGCWINQAMNVVARLGIADFLVDSSKTVEELAQLTNSNKDALYRVLRATASVGVFTEEPPYSFGLTPTAEYLLSDNPFSLRYVAIMHGDEWHWRSIGDMLHTVKTGEPAIRKFYQVNSYWEYLIQNNDDSCSNFNRGMLQAAKNYHAPFVDYYDFSNISTVVDIAGGEGQLLASILKKNTHLQGILYDMPQTLESAVDFLKNEQVFERCQIISGNMFESVPAGGDVYILCYTMMDWDNESCVKILEKIRKVILSHGKLLVIDPLVPQMNEPSWIKWVDLFELVCGPGKTRDEAEYKKVFEKAGFYWQNTISLSTPSFNTPSSVLELIPLKID